MRQLTQSNMLLGKIKTFLNPTEDMSQRELSMALNKIVKSLNIDCSFDVPYLAGYSKDAKTIYIDKRVPKFLQYKNKRYDIHRFLVLHEIIEKALIDHLGHIHYQLAHEIASRAEYAAINGEGLLYHYYNSVIQEKLFEIREQQIYCIPEDLDLKPYLDSKDRTLLKRINDARKITWTKLKNSKLKLNYNPAIVKQIIKRSGNFPNNSRLPFLVYKQVLMLHKSSLIEVKALLKKNGWQKIWVDGMFDYDHYHSNTHEALVIFSGECVVQVGGPNKKKITVTAGDVIIFPAGVSHKRIEASDDFKSIGCYPFAINYDINVGKPKEHPLVDEIIEQVKLPKTDPIFGKNGLLLKLWK